MRSLPGDRLITVVFEEPGVGLFEVTDLSPEDVTLMVAEWGCSIFIHSTYDQCTVCGDKLPNNRKPVTLAGEPVCFVCAQVARKGA